MTTKERAVEPSPQKRIRKTKTYPVAVFDVEQRTEMNVVLVSIFSNVITQNHVFSWEVSEEVRDYLEDSKEEYDLIISIQLFFAHLLYGGGSYVKPTELVKKVLSKDLEIEDKIPFFHPQTKFGIFLHQFINRMNQSEKKHWMFSPKSEGENISFWSSTFFGNIDAIIEEEEEKINENENKNKKEKENEIKNENENKQEQKDENKIKTSRDSQFQSLNIQQIPIYVEHHNLYTSIDKFLNQIVGENLNVVLFTKLPKILLFEIQENEKISNYKLFKYEKAIYMDRFLMKNSHQVKQKKIQEKNHHKTIKKVEREIQKLENWKSSKISVLDGLKHTLNYLKLQQQQSSQNSERSNNLEKIINVLNQQIENFLKQLKKLSDQQERLRNQINLLYKEMNQTKYFLDSVIFKKIVQNKGMLIFVKLFFNYFYQYIKLNQLPDYIER
ncbi:uba domain-containing protein rup1 [Anaeramoeba flamelloides]|uniref:Uba domain-containing protein rup1 n=1 Tax=Anaeramoeba flamelloides TaxID=1746091 RepID=A0AAV7Z662_9EUKA|nr:uba domain-containing protein rup1 [Anaeramoeba flamelloides]